jgi:hypothetical protein
MHHGRGIISNTHITFEVMKYFSRILLILVFSSALTACKHRKKTVEEQQDSPALKIYRASGTYPAGDRA